MLLLALVIALFSVYGDGNAIDERAEPYDVVCSLLNDGADYRAVADIAVDDLYTSTSAKARELMREQLLPVVGRALRNGCGS